MNPALAVLSRDMMTRPRRRWFYIKRLTLVVIVGLIVGVGGFIQCFKGSSTVGLGIFQGLAQSTLVATCLLSVLAATVLLNSERQGRTLELLFLTDITPARLVFGKYINSVLSISFMILSVLPIFVLSVNLGGISTGQIVCAFAVLLATALLGSAVGLFSASVAKTDRRVTGLSVLLLLLIFGILPVAIWGISIAMKKSPEAALHLVSPFVVMNSLIMDLEGSRPFSYCAFSIILALPLVGFACALMSGEMASEDAQKTISAFVQRSKKPGESRFFGTRRGNLMSWRELNFAYAGNRWASPALLFLVSAVLTTPICLVVGASFEALFVANLSVMTIAGLLGFALSCISNASKAFSSEKAGNTLDCLLLTSLTPREIVWGKLGAVYRAGLPWLLFAMPSFIAVIALLDMGEDCAVLIGIFMAVLGQVALMTCLALWLSIVMRRMAVLGICFGVFVFWTSCLRMIVIMPFTIMASMIAAGIASATGDAGGGALAGIIGALPSVIVDLLLGGFCLLLLLTTFRRAAMVRT